MYDYEKIAKMYQDHDISTEGFITKLQEMPNVNAYAAIEQLSKSNAQYIAKYLFLRFKSLQRSLREQQEEVSENTASAEEQIAKLEALYDAWNKAGWASSVSIAQRALLKACRMVDCRVPEIRELVIKYQEHVADYRAGKRGRG